MALELPEQGLTSDAPEELALAALSRADHVQAVAHLARTLESAPGECAWLSALERALDEAPDRYALVGDSLPMLAYVQAYGGHLNNALRTLRQVPTAPEGPPYYVWLERWLKRPGALEALDVTLVTGAIFRVLARAPEQRPTGAQREALAQFDGALRLLVERRPGAAVLWAASALWRKLGERALALTCAQGAWRLDRRWQVALTLAHAHHACGDLSGALDALDDAARLSATRQVKTQLTLERGLMLCEGGQLEPGIDALDDVLVHEGAHAIAYPTRWYYATRLHDRDDDYLKLAAYAQQHPDNALAQAHLKALGDARPYERGLPEPMEPTLREAMAWATGRAAQPLALWPRLEAPSARLALELWAASLKLAPLSHEVSQLPDAGGFDPRLVRHGARHALLWRYDGATPHPLVAPAPPRWCVAIWALAMTPYHASTWWKRARAMLDEVQEAATPQGLLGAMVHVGAVPPGHTPWGWVMRVQIATALVIARLDEQRGARDEGALLLMNLARGPVDWSVSAALVALARVGQQRPLMRRALLQLWEELEGDARAWPCCFELCLSALSPRARALR